MTSEKTLINIKSMGKARSTADQRKNAAKSAVSRDSQVIRDGNADSTTFNLQKKSTEKLHKTLH